MGHCQRGDSLQYCQSNNPLPVGVAVQPTRALVRSAAMLRLQKLGPVVLHVRNCPQRMPALPRSGSCGRYVHGIWQCNALKLGPVHLAALPRTSAGSVEPVYVASRAKYSRTICMGVEQCRNRIQSHSICGEHRDPPQCRIYIRPRLSP